LQVTDVTLDHFKRATADVGAHGDNDVLPFDIDNRFIAERQDALAAVAFTYYRELSVASEQDAKTRINSLLVFSERLLAPAAPCRLSHYHQDPSLLEHLL
jgi:hypothetical protein